MSDTPPNPKGPNELPPPPPASVPAPPPSATSTLPPAAGGAAPKKPNQIVRIGIGCLGVIVLGCVAIGGIAMFQNYQQDQNYATGHTAYTNADCATAVEPLRKAANGDPGTKDRDVARSAEAELQECEALLEGQGLADSGDAAAAVLSLAQFAAKYELSPLKPGALIKGQELTKANEPAALATIDLCQSLGDLENLNFVISPDETLPPLLYACGQTFEQEQAFGDAVIAYSRFRDEFPEHALAADVDDAYVRATIADADLTGAGSLPPPQAVGSSDSDGQVVVVIQNDTPEKLSMVFSGPETRVEELEPCTDCESFTSAPEACPEKGPVGRYLLAPGSYKVVVKTISGNDVTPFRGDWELDGGQEYNSCFYVVSN
jgi:hypothetical protein